MQHRETKVHATINAYDCSLNNHKLLRRYTRYTILANLNIMLYKAIKVIKRTLLNSTSLIEL